MARTTDVLVTVLLCIFAGLFSIHIQAADVIYKQTNPVTVTKVNGTFWMQTQIYNHDYSIVHCKITPPKSSSLRETGFPHKSDYFTPRIRPIVATSYPSQHCGFILHPVWKSDEGEWTLDVTGHTGNSNLTLTGELRVEDTSMPAAVHPKEDDVRQGEKTILHLILPTKLLLYGDYQLLSCVVIHPNGTEVLLTPSSPSTRNSRIAYSPGSHDGGLHDGQCNVAIRDVSSEDSGKWKLKAVHNASRITFIGESILNVTTIIEEGKQATDSTTVITLLSVGLAITLCALVIVICKGRRY